MDADIFTALRAPFPPEQIGQIPKGGVQLDYVGHADVTDRLLAVDPDWSWEPMGRTPEGLPALDQFGNLWILLTVAGVTRPGVGDGKSMKECVGDALRNAAMRFGVALDLWAKGDRSFGLAGHDAPDRAQIPNERASLRTDVMARARGRFADRSAFLADFLVNTRVAFDAASPESLREYLAHLELSAAPNTPVREAEPAQVAPPGQGDNTAPTTDPVTSIRDRALTAAKKRDVMRLMNEATRDGVTGAMTTDAAGNGVILDKLLSDRLAKVPA